MSDDLHIGGFRQVVYTIDSPVTWSISLHSIRTGSQVYGSFLEEFPESHGDTAGDEHNLSSLNRWLVEEDYLDFGGHATGMCLGL